MVPKTIALPLGYAPERNDKTIFHLPQGFLGILGLEPKTHGLKGRRSTIELYALCPEFHLSSSSI
jgi:hypothetical protein